ncbi:LysR family transcriptional regulator [Leminorella grimontii]|uniref:LysR family transcriptional regulator n=1 Tax=Leminorella grimontii TaxID=82981 RepID=A0AAV5N263_9GAMM|nr:LysR family transcriptional regulator [Leminorella grimontii]KFC95191.1 LysR family transcriptional regulator [Leminorella grimontii ATCC 33999 = DSM 5078]GKX56211.1 LysR family transcriptional regulator [Leminorella grimontii]GKX60391.1 LysR family transcriptional regulator [Leminorella grimontii]VFS60968.1 Ben and cat operon transcriptional regulator [Leminorella grimontii]
MELNQLRCFIAVADELHFGHAAQKLDMLPSALGRYVKLLEEELGIRLLTRSTRNVSLTPHGRLFLDEVRSIVSGTDSLVQHFQKLGRQQGGRLRIGTIDSTAVSLIPPILHAFRSAHPDVDIQIVEDKTSRLLPKLQSGHLDLAFIRPAERQNEGLESRFLFYEDIVLAISDRHPLARLDEVRVEDLADIPLIVPQRRVRPHSHDLTLNLFQNARLKPLLIQIGDEKQTIINMVAAEIGGAVMPRWVTRMSLPNVSFVPLAKEYEHVRKMLPVAAVWVKGIRDEARDNMMSIVSRELEKVSARC